MKIALAIAATLLATTGLSLAEPGDKGNGIGGCIDSLYGNATNERPSGHGVLPTQSPGPFVNEVGGNEPPRNDRVRGSSVGDVNKALADANIEGVSNTRDFCNTYGTFP